MRISATIITLNEEKNLRRACESLREIADEIIVVDSQSQDCTREVALEFTPHVFMHPFKSYSEQKNLAASKASHPWILSIDADECLSDGLKQSLLGLKSGPAGAEVAAYRFARRANYLGGWIQHSGWYPDYKIRLYDRNRARWVGEYVHETLVVDGPVESLPGELLHYTVLSISDHVSRLDRYTTLAARQSASVGKRFSLMNCLLAPPLTFLKSYFLQGGLLDGWRGLSIAAFASWYVFLKQVKLREIQNSDRVLPGSNP
ncbi:MAG: glycosyltransferase family 2 protein [Acidobacteriia bacterium]|nr:glycosyltransferase family 2 protein [Terriglobia bacterium]